MRRETVRGNKELAKVLNVGIATVQRWRKSGILRPAALSEYGRVIIYDLEKVYECLNYKPVKAGRRAV